MGRWTHIHIPYIPHLFVAVAVVVVVVAAAAAAVSAVPYVAESGIPTTKLVQVQ